MKRARVKGRQGGSLRLGHDVDEVFYEAYRESLLAAGATGADLDALVEDMVRFVVDGTIGQPEKRTAHLELIANDLACTDMDVRIRDDVTVIRVDYPSRPTVQ